MTSIYNINNDHVVNKTFTLQLNHYTQVHRFISKFISNMNTFNMNTFNMKTFNMGYSPGLTYNHKQVAGKPFCTERQRKLGFNTQRPQW